ALVATDTHPVASPIYASPDLRLFYLAIHYVLIVWLLLGDRLRRITHLPAAWPALFLFSSYLYFRTFFTLEHSVPYPLFYILIFAHLLLHPPSAIRKFPHSQTRRFVNSPIRYSLFTFLLFAGFSTVFSAAPGESLPHYFQVVCFALLPFLLTRDLSASSRQALSASSRQALSASSRQALTDTRAWRDAALWSALLGGVILVVLAGVTFGILVHNLGLAPALHYHLFMANIGANWISRPLVTLLPLGIGFLLTTTNRWRKWI
ncbi:unnamed protein product, partial [marine sediment metagenome]